MHIFVEQECCDLKIILCTLGTINVLRRQNDIKPGDSGINHSFAPEE